MRCTSVARTAVESKADQLKVLEPKQHNNNYNRNNGNNHDQKYYQYYSKRFFATSRGYHPGENRGRNFFFGFLVGTGAIAVFVSITDKLLHPEGPDDPNKQKVVILGSGWGGLSCASELDTKRYEVSVVSPRNYFVYTPWINDLAFGKVDVSSITETLRAFFERQGKSKVQAIEAVALDVDPVNQTIKCRSTIDQKEFTLPYDKLVLAVGSNPDVSVPGVKDFCHTLKDLDDAKQIRGRVIDCFEAANVPNRSSEEKKKLLNFVVVGDSAHAIQFAKDLTEFVDDYKTQFSSDIRKLVQVTLVANPTPDPNTYQHKINHYYKHNVLVPLEKKKGFKVTELDIQKVERDSLVVLKQPEEAESAKSKAKPTTEKVPFGVCVWLNGDAPHPIVQSLQKRNPTKQKNRRALVTNQFLQVKGFNNIYAIGDCSTVDQAHILKKMEEVFHSLDENKDGFIDEGEFKNLVKRWSREFPQLMEINRQATTLFEQSDVNKDGKLSQEEFRTVLTKVDENITSFPATAQVAQQQGRYIGASLNQIFKESDVRALFKELDADKSGHLDASEVRTGLRKLMLPCSKKDVQAFMASSDTNQDGKIDEDEFVSFVLERQQKVETGDWKKLTHVRIIPFRYKHLGGFEYVGYEQKITERGSEGKSILDGNGAWWMWNSILVSKLLPPTIYLELAMS
eukprot:CAMPEP_0168556020 /NCGR_PEP_ID=MMETSP0413-20121227/8655_1 /TAXON_ID=136452 /ORGANISM="Filamoeba nolandi, Strain NC-AS-23-1" /LENGTH=680 /DNA_ID=CAMNT_0008586929 /DNA_START=1 /DNA_END=2039 /DNA_ORIENTATION=+